MCVDIFRSWFETQGERVPGEITKEQARGPEAKSMIPEEDQAIKKGAMSAPTLQLALNLLLDMAEKSDATYQFLQ